MNLLIDTNRYCDFCSGDREALQVVRRARNIFMPLIVLAELRAGFLCGTLARRNERGLTTFLNSERVAVLRPDEDTSHHYGRIFAQLRMLGRPIPTHDIWIAALAVQHDLILYSRDDHFSLLPQIVRV
ncbi:type II toxin-antitoxin system VapC family toxin [Kiritimatiella glycovorans]|uniref:VapC-mt4 n=1 Tax=Kiritimatiella glycovorans TaxID=1307763 RepID=A0A0G3EM95_9BACT|nr:type II toxin-antitoxin system VapC family toxin [Kiritimatiella glycovorans]AKJ65279.1 VapC-mt4 [Kiritimatiella glycovorans]